ncbi:MAG: tetraacyldisaccharide 4'-kinase, partial [Betaproteobacteria bacterium]
VQTNAPAFSMRLNGQKFYRLGEASQTCLVDYFQGKRLYALAGIGDPTRFFTQLEALSLVFEAHPFPDHHSYSAGDLAFSQDGVLLMTEKDAVKCNDLVINEAWVLPVEAQLEALSDGRSLLNIILEKLDGRTLA